MARLDDLETFYELMEELEEDTGGRRRLGDCDPTKDRSDGGVYFFFEKGERRSGSGKGKRVVRGGKCVSYSDRISRKHKGPAADTLRGSVFRRWVHNAMYRKYRRKRFADWPDIEEETSLQRMIDALSADQKRRLGRLTSEHMWPMRLLFLPISNESDRRYIEKNAITLLSEYRKNPIDPPSRRWLGRHSCSERIRCSGLWNSDHVSNGYDPEFLDRLEEYVDEACDS